MQNTGRWVLTVGVGHNADEETLDLTSDLDKSLNYNLYLKATLQSVG